MRCLGGLTPITLHLEPIYLQNTGTKPRNASIKLFADFTFRCYNECNEKILCVLCKNAINDETFKKYNPTEKSPFAENGHRRWNNRWEAVTKHSNSVQHRKAFEYYRRLHCARVSDTERVNQSVLRSLTAEQDGTSAHTYIRVFLFGSMRLLKKYWQTMTSTTTNYAI